MLGLSKKELSIFKKLSTPIKIQDFLDALPINWEKNGETYMSPREVLLNKKAHCLEGALLAGVALWLNGEKPLLLDLKAEGDIDHVIAIYKRNGYWGAISKTNHPTLRFRDPVYKNIRELALSYFHEYFNDTNGKKCLRSYSTKPFNIKKLGTKWITSKENLHYIAQMIDDAPHELIFPKKNNKFIRKADNMERKAGKLIEWKKEDHRT
ncbi:MAG: hypothetical protein NTZ44_01810 [Candidatus Nomurabacteria bacterium]|nr:hypothetical protein [Candidatus Nomurabacteria bacterium]